MKGYSGDGDSRYHSEYIHPQAEYYFDRLFNSDGSLVDLMKLIFSFANGKKNHKAFFVDLLHKLKNLRTRITETSNSEKKPITLSLNVKAM